MLWLGIIVFSMASWTISWHNLKLCTKCFNANRFLLPVCFSDNSTASTFIPRCVYFRLFILLAQVIYWHLFYLPVINIFKNHFHLIDILVPINSHHHSLTYKVFLYFFFISSWRRLETTCSKGNAKSNIFVSIIFYLINNNQLCLVDEAE